jgi:hypothetical protein
MLFYTIGALHGIFGLVGLFIAHKIAALVPTPSLSRGRILYAFTNSTLGSTALVLCAWASWQMPFRACWFALASLLAFLVSPVRYSRNSTLGLTFSRRNPNFAAIVVIRLGASISLAILAQLAFGLSQDG